MRLELDLLEKENPKPGIRQLYETLVNEMAIQEERYGQERREIEKEARRLERERDIASSRDPYFDYAEVLLQIVIVMATVSILAQSRIIFGVALIGALLGAALGLNGFLLLFRLPFLSS
jgi:hypothetical protein